MTVANPQQLSLFSRAELLGENEPTIGESSPAPQSPQGAAGQDQVVETMGEIAGGSQVAAESPALGGGVNNDKQA